MIKFLADIFKDKKGRLLPSVKEIKRINELTIIRLQGDIDFDTVRIVSGNINDETKGKFDRNIVLDFENVTNVDSSTLAYMISLLDKLQKQHRKLGIINTNPQLNSYITIEKVNSIIHKYKNEEEAIKNLA